MAPASIKNQVPSYEKNRRQLALKHIRLTTPPLKRAASRAWAKDSSAKKYRGRGHGIDMQTFGPTTRSRSGRAVPLSPLTGQPRLLLSSNAMLQIEPGESRHPRCCAIPLPLVMPGTAKQRNPLNRTRITTCFLAVASFFYRHPSVSDQQKVSYAIPHSLFVIERTFSQHGCR